MIPGTPVEEEAAGWGSAILSIRGRWRLRLRRKGVRSMNEVEGGGDD